MARRLAVAAATFTVWLRAAVRTAVRKIHEDNMIGVCYIDNWTMEQGNALQCSAVVESRRKKDSMIYNSFRNTTATESGCVCAAVALFIHTVRARKKYARIPQQQIQSALLLSSLVLL